MAECEVCFRHCHIEEGRLGFCGARTAENGRVVPYHYGRISGLALDPIEKKPLARFCPGSMILSVGGFGCNLRCPFCQNDDISWSAEASRYAEQAEQVFRRPSLPVEKKTKRGLSTLDIAPHILVLSREGDALRLWLRADSPTINAADLRKAMSGSLGEERPMRCLRLRLLTENKESFQ